MRTIGALLGMFIASSAFAAEEPAPGHGALGPTKHNVGREVAVPLTDAGTALALDPYVNDVGLTPGRMERFRRLYVDPDTYAAGLAPQTPPVAARPNQVGPFPDGGIGAGQTVKLEMDRRLFPETIVPLADVAKAINASGAGKAEASGADTLMVTLGAEGAPALFGFTIGPIKGKLRRVTDVATLWLPAPPVAIPVAPPPIAPPVEPVPPVTTGKGSKTTTAQVEAPPPAGVPELQWVAAVIEPAELPAVATSGVLTVSNRRSTWAEFSINGEKVGIIGPYTDGYIHDVKAGEYEIHLKLSNGYAFTQRASTQPEAPEWPPVLSGMQQRQP